MPLVVAVHLYLRPTGWRATVERAELLAIAVLCGIDQGTATIAAHVDNAVTGLMKLMEPVMIALLGTDHERRVAVQQERERLFRPIAPDFERADGWNFDSS